MRYGILEALPDLPLNPPGEEEENEFDPDQEYDDYVEKRNN
jgi:hypothetical protein